MNFNKCDKIKVSVVAPCYNEELTILELLRRITEVCRDVVCENYEIILVDDGSTDATWQILSDFSSRDSHVVSVKLHRNHGHQLAVTAGLAVARGERVLLIDADLQDPPELLRDMMAVMDHGADVVYGVRKERKGESKFKLLTAWMFYKILDMLSSTPIPRDTGDFRLMNRNIVDVLTAMPEHHRFIRGMVSWIGGNQVPLYYDRDARFAGVTKYPLSKMIRFALDAITGFSTVPLRLATWLGVIAAGVAVLVSIYAVYRWLTNDIVPGWASTLIVSAFLSGTQLVVLGIIGEYLGRLVEEAKGRPLFMIGAITIKGVSYSVPMNFSELSANDRLKCLQNIMQEIPAEMNNDYVS